MIDGFKSFPSGHTSCNHANPTPIYPCNNCVFFWLVAFAGLTYFSLYLAGKFNLFDQKGEGVSVIMVDKGINVLSFTADAKNLYFLDPNPWCYAHRDLSLPRLPSSLGWYLDWRHHWWEYNGRKEERLTNLGSFPGLICAFFAYRQYYPPLYEGGSPYNSRIIRHNQNFQLDEESQQHERYRDDEQPS